ncbi:transposase [Candidatus Poribacteria bacterium]|nr:transposase [Candidatus Poribacteria bacterium]
MARPLRIEYEGAVYHITARGNEKKAIFRDEADYETFLELLKQLPERFAVVIHGYVLMTNHYHILVETPQPNITRAMHYLNSTYTGYFNRVHRHAGHVLQGRYKAFLIQKDRYLLAVSRYIHLNPVRAGLVARPEAYKWSSYSQYLGRRRADGWLSRAWVLEQYSKDPAQARRLYRRFVEEGIQAPENPFKSLVAGLVLGTEVFVEEIKKRLSIDRHRDVPQTRTLARNLTYEDILAMVAEQVGGEEKAIIARGRRDVFARGVCLYLLRTLTDMRNDEIGARFGISHSAVSKAVSNMKRQMACDRKTKKSVAEIECKLLNSKFKT